MGPKKARSSLLTLRDETIILAYRWRTRLALDWPDRDLSASNDRRAKRTLQL